MKYKGFLLATAGGVATMSGAQAADLPVKAPRVMPPPVTSWEGFYLGLNAGVVSQTGNYTPYYGSYANNQGSTGFIGGGQLGYNWQRGNYVYGLEADISGLTGKTIAPPLSGSVGKGNGFEGRISWLSTFRARAGWLMNPNTMLYATGGLAVGGVKNSFNFNGLASSSNPLNTTKSVSTTRVGWTVGGGIESMLDQHWTVGLEGLYVDLGSSSATTPTGKTTTFRNTAVIGRAKLNYKF
jgi:outer membrane immunogenic protein